MTPAALQHLTVTTGHIRRSPRDEVSDEAVAIVRAAIAAGGRIGPTEWSIALVPGVDEGGYIYDLLHRDRLVVTCWLCADRAAEVPLWASATRAPRLPGVQMPAGPPAMPWLAAAIEPTPEVLHDPERQDIYLTVGDLERVVAWALLE